MTRMLYLSAAALAVASWATPPSGFAATARELGEMLARREQITVIDIRGGADFAEGHIPGAINVSAEIVAKKRLPPFGRVVVCGDGIRSGEAAAVAALNAKPGIHAEALEGGIGAWEALNLPSTRGAGLKKVRDRYLSYQEVAEVAAQNPDLVLVDLRRDLPDAPGAPAQGTAEGRFLGKKAAQATGRPGDLSDRFPGHEKIHLGRRPDGEVSATALTARKDPERRKVYVLVDDGDGEAEKVAHRLRAAGVGQVVILTGGDRALAREGRPGLTTSESGK